MNHVVYVIESGNFELEVDGCWQLLEVGNLYFIPAHHWHRRRLQAAMEKHWLHFSLVSAALDLCLGMDRHLGVYPMAEHPAWAVAMAAVPQVLAGQGTMDQAAAIESLILQLIADRRWSFNREPGRVQTDSRIERAVQFLDRTYVNSPPLEAVAAEAGYSVRHLHDQFTRQVGCSPAAYALARRMRDAEGLLRSTKLPIKDIAQACGYADSLHFSRVIRRHFGRSPRQLRASAADA